MPPGAKTREGYRAMEKTIGRKLIAERAGVSMRTVTRVLQGDKLVAEQTRLRVLEVVDELGYTRNKIAGNLSRNKNSNFVVVLVPDMSNYYYLEIFDYLTKFFEKYDYIVSICRINENNLFKTFDTMLENRVSVIINLGFFPINEEYLKKINSAKIKIIHPGVGTDPVPINIDYSAAMEEAFCFFLGRGLKKFKFVCGGGKNFLEDGRIHCFLQLLDKYGLEKNENSIIWGDYPASNAMETGETAVKKIYQTEEPDVIFFLTDAMAFGGMQFLTKIGKKIGEDISVIGFDNTLMSKFCVPPLSTIDSSTEIEIQRYITYILDKNLNNDTIVSKFIKRASSV